ncbi:MAG TPA: redoxin domain-containing protein [Kofleriaceae bacterium]|nr:redoxin domain-containing protein [Kofleriaceae bacterium]
MKAVTFALVFAGLSACSGADEPPAAATGTAAVKEGNELIGKPAPGWQLDTWFNSKPLALADLRGKVVLVRWFMSPDCPFCSATAPSLNLLDDRYRERGLVVLGFYHHKNPEPLRAEAVKGYLEHYRFRFPVAIDPDWKTLKRWWLDRERGWTSVSFLLDRKGMIRFIHPGGKYAPGSHDLAEIERKIRSLLAE